MSGDEGDPQQFEIDFIYKDKMINRVQHFYVHWKGYDDSENSWVAINDMACDDLMDEYYERKNDDAGGKKQVKKGKKRLDSESSTSTKNTVSSDQPCSSKKGSFETPKNSKQTKIKIRYAGKSESESDVSPKKKTPSREPKEKEVTKPKRRVIIESDSEPDEPVVKEPQSSKTKKVSKEMEKTSVEPVKESASPKKKSSDDKTKTDDEKEKKKRKRKNKSALEAQNLEKEGSEASVQKKPLPDALVRSIPPKIDEAVQTMPKVVKKEVETISTLPEPVENTDNMIPEQFSQSTQSSTFSTITVPPGFDADFLESQNSTSPSRIELEKDLDVSIPLESEAASPAPQEPAQSLINANLESEAPDVTEPQSVPQEPAQSSIPDNVESEALAVTEPQPTPQAPAQSSIPANLESEASAVTEPRVEVFESESIRRRNAQKAAYNALVEARMETIRKNASQSRTDSPATSDENKDPEAEIEPAESLSIAEPMVAAGSFDGLDNVGANMSGFNNENLSGLRSATVLSNCTTTVSDASDSPLREDVLMNEDVDSTVEEHDDEYEEDDDDLVTADELQRIGDLDAPHDARQNSPKCHYRNNGFDRGFKAECILFFIVEPGVRIEEISTTGSERAFGAVKFFNRNVIEPISYNELRERAPRLLVEYFQRMQQRQAAKGMDITRPSEFIPIQAENLEILDSPL